MCGRITQDLPLTMLFDRYRLSRTTPAPNPARARPHADTDSRTSTARTPPIGTCATATATASCANDSAQRSLLPPQTRPGFDPSGQGGEPRIQSARA